MNTRILITTIVLAVVHFALVSVLIVVSMQYGLHGIENHDGHASAIERVVYPLFDILLEPGKSLWGRWGLDNNSNVAAWGLIAANSFICGFGLSLILNALAFLKRKATDYKRLEGGRGLWCLRVTLLIVALVIGVVIYLRLWHEAPTAEHDFSVEVSTTKSGMTFTFGDDTRMDFVLIPAGKFLMGSKFSAAEIVQKFPGVFKEAAYYREHPQHEVAISKPFYIGIYEVTQAQWRAVMGTEPWKDRFHVESGAYNPASCVTWNDAIKFCDVLSKKTGKKVALPSESQWEYACRAGSKTVFYFGDDASRLGDYAWYIDNASETGEPTERVAHAVGQKLPNRSGLYDMYGNVGEWCRDYYGEQFYSNAKNIDPENTTEAEFRIVRGGSWWFDVESCRSASRFMFWPDSTDGSFGFRVVVSSGSSVD